MIIVKANTSVTISMGPFLDKTDGVTEETGLTMVAGDVRLNKNGGGFGPKSDATAPSHQENGWYTVALGTTDTDTEGLVVVKVDDAATHLPVWAYVHVMAESAYDALFGTGQMPADVQTWRGTQPLILTSQRVECHMGTKDGAIDLTANEKASVQAECEDAIDAKNLCRALASGTADSGTTTTLVDAARTEGDTDYWKGAWLVVTSGNISGQARKVSAFNAATDTITVERAFTQAVGTNTYELWPADFPNNLSALSIDTNGRADIALIEGVDATDQIRDAVVSDATRFPGAAITEARLSELDAATGGKMANQVDLIKTEADKIALADAGAGVAGSVIEEVENRATQADILSDATPFAGGNVDATVSSRATPAQVNTEVVDVLKIDTVTLPGQVAPPATPTMEEILAHIYKAYRNKKEQTASLWSLYDDAGTTVDQKATVSDDGTTGTKEEIISGP